MKVNIPPWLRQLPPRSQWITGVFFCAVLGVLYFVTRTEVHTFDALSYTWALEAKPFGLLFHPHHLLYGPLGWLAYKAALLIGYHGHADTPVQLVNAFVGGFGILFFWRFGTRLTGRPFTTLGVSLLIGLCYSYWVYAGEVEVYTLAAAFLMLALWILKRLDERPNVKFAVGLGLAHAGAILFHQTNVLFGLAIIAFFLTKPNLRHRNILAGYGAGSAIPVLVSYGYVAYASRFPNLQSFFLWFTDYARSGQWGRFLSFEHLPALRSGLATAVSIEPWLALIFYLLVSAAVCASLFQTLRKPGMRPWLVMAGVWLFSYVIFFWWWEPWNIEFWISILPMWGIWMLAPWCAGEEIKEPAPQVRIDFSLLSKAVFAVLPPLLALGLLSAHLAPIQEQGDAGNDYYRQVTEALSAIVLPGELVVTRGNVLDLYIPFYAGHSNIISMRQLAQDSGGEPEQATTELMKRLDMATVTGQPFLIDQFILDEVREAVRNPFGLTRDEISVISSRYALEPVVYRGDQLLFYGSPRTVSAGRTDWLFIDSLEGWEAWGVEDPRFERGGWCFSGGIDPQMKGPVINLDGDEWSDLALDISLDTEVSYAQIFWRSPQNDYSLDNSWETTITRGRQVYVVPLADAPGWGDTIAQIRVDPIPGSVEGEPKVTACIHEVMFLKSEE